MPAPALICAAMEVALNRYLRLEPAAIDDCARLAGQRIGMAATDLGLSFVIEFIAGGVTVGGDLIPAPHVSVSAASPRLLMLALRSLTGDRANHDAVQIDGDAELLERFVRLLRRVDFDAEELLAPLLAPLGEGASHRVAGGLKALLGWGRFAAGRLEQDTAEYLQEETGDLARPDDVEAWMDAVDAARARLDRATARIASLEQARRTSAADKR